MALATTVTKKSVTEVQSKLWNVTLNMTLDDGAEEVINKDYALHYRLGDSIAAKQATWVALMQADIDKYKSEQTIYNAAALSTVVTNVGSALVV
jgi:hypothetical protein